MIKILVIASALLASSVLASTTQTVPITLNATGQITVPDPVPGATGPAGPTGAPGASPTAASVESILATDPNFIKAVAAAMGSTPTQACTTPQPASTTATESCPSGTTGSWTQTTTYLAAAPPSCWVGAVAPTSAPAGACVAPVPSGTAPTNVTATPWPTQALVAFTPPAPLSGKTISSYTVTGPAWLTNTGPASPIMTLGGWSPGSTNSFTVVANYSDGTKSPTSAASAKVIPQSVGTVSTSPNVYKGGVFYWGGDYSFGSGMIEAYADQTCKPTAGADFEISYSSSGGWQPFAPQNTFDLTPYKFLNFRWQSNTANDPLTITVEVAGDQLVGNATVIQDATYGGAPQPGVWGTYKVPLSVMGIGVPAGIPNLYKLSIQNKSGTFARKECFEEIYFSAT